MSDLDKDIEILKEHIKELDEEKVLYGGFLSRKQAIENVLRNLKIKEIENKDLKEKLYIQGNLTETYKKIAERLAKRIDKLDEENYNYCQSGETHCKETNRCIQCIIDWARSEVLKDE